ncbi:hypothetical protein [Haloferax sp. YSMS24]|uniref:hypothetical protein n=1 Tax=Haloferax sp. YSMS24 TaxID=3388425 RepID=UPI00398C9B64
MRWSLRAILGSLQLPISGVGLVVLVLTWQTFRTLPPSPPQSDGFVEGLAAFFLLVLGLAGYVLFVGGLLIPPGPGYGIEFTRKQRWLFAYALAAPVAGVAIFFAGIASMYDPGDTMEFVFGVLSLAVVGAPLALLTGIGWKAVQVAVDRY